MTEPAPRTPAAFFPLPQGLGVSGVVTWAVDLCNALAGRGWSVGVAIHPERAGYAQVHTEFHPSVRVTDLTGLPAVGATGSDLGWLTRAYRDAMEQLGWSAASPCVMLPSLDADCYAAAAAIGAVDADRVRVVGWQHSDTAFDTRLMQTYEPVLHRVVGVSTRITDRLASLMPWRGGDVLRIPYGVPVPEPRPASGPDEPVRLIYAGRMEHEQKRVGVLCQLARLLHDRRVPFRLTLVGDGPAAGEIDAALEPIDGATRLPAGDRARVRALLNDSDAMVLPSRYEGLSIAMLECLAAGVVPVVARVDSGVSDAIQPGENGLVVEADADTPEAELAARFADAVASLAADRALLERLRRAAHATAAAHFNHDLHADRCEAVFRAVLSEPPRAWPADRPTRFSPAVGPAQAGAHGTVPSDASARAAESLARWRADHPSERIAVYGAGRHTLAIAEALAAHASAIDCVVDDDPTRHGGTLWGWPVLPLAGLRARGVGDVLISSWIHREPMARRCAAAGLVPIDPYAPRPAEAVTR